MTTHLTTKEKLKHGQNVFFIPHWCHRCNTVLYGDVVTRKGSTYPGTVYYHVKCADVLNLYP